MLRDTVGWCPGDVVLHTLGFRGAAERDQMCER
jgi:hypothetical protein